MAEETNPVPPVEEKKSVEEQVLYRSHPSMFRNHPMWFGVVFLFPIVGIALAIWLEWNQHF